MSAAPAVIAGASRRGSGSDALRRYYRRAGRERFWPGRRAAAIHGSIVRKPESPPSWFYLAACHGRTGEAALAHEALAVVECISPDCTIDRVRSIAAYRRSEDLTLLLDGLRRAGMAG